MWGFLLLSDARRHAVQFVPRIGNLALRLFLLWACHLRQGFGEPPAGAFEDGCRHFQFVFHGSRCGLGGRRLPLRFQKQFRLGEETLAPHTRAVPPGGIELSGLPRVAMALDEGGGHALRVLDADVRHRHQVLHRQLRAQQPLAHLLLDRPRELFHQRQAPRYPAHTAVEAPRQLLQGVTEALLHLTQQPALFQRAFWRTQAQRPLQQQSFGFAHRPHGGFDGVPSQFFERRDAFVAVDHQIAVGLFGQSDYHDRDLLARVSQRRHQLALPARLADSQVFPPPVELVKLQLHDCWPGDQYASRLDGSFAVEAGVC
jgi:hypothetical protein